MILAVTGASTHQGWGYTAVKLCAYTFFGPLALKKKKEKKRQQWKSMKSGELGVFLMLVVITFHENPL